MSYQQALAWLYSLQRFGVKLGLENIRRLLLEIAGGGDFANSAGHPAIIFPFKVIHVAGTNGKGSVCAMISAISRAQGFCTGLFTSPHLLTFRERIRVNGEMISKEAAASGLAVIRDLVAGWQPHPTFFEVTTALAIQYFADTGVEVAVLETGLGGRLDATSAVQSNVSVITTIDFDHEKWLGKTIAEIASEKAGIIKPRVPVICALQQPDAEKVIRMRAAQCDAPLEFVTKPYGETPIALVGSYQKQNAALAVAACRAANIKIDSAAVAGALAQVDWPARFQRWNKRTVIDGAHNPGAARVLVATWREIFGDRKATLLLAIFADKNLRAICHTLAPISDSILLPKIRSERAANPETLAKILNEIVPSVPCSVIASIPRALEIARARPNPILITGSLHFAGEVLAHLRGEPAAFEECAQ